MGDTVTEHECLLERSAAKVEITVFHPEVIPAVRLVFDREGRGDGFIEDRNAGNLDFDLSGRHFEVFALALNDFTCRLDDKLASEGGRRFDKISRSVRLDDKLCDAVAVAEIDKGHTSEFTGLLDPAGEGNPLPGVRDAELSASMCSVHKWTVFQFSPQR